MGAAVAKYRDYSAAELAAIIDTSGIPLKALDTCARLIYEWEQSGEPDARLVVIEVAKVLARASSSLRGSA